MVQPRVVLALNLAFMSVVSCRAVPAAEPIALVAVDSWHIDYDTHHVQGLAVTEKAFWISSVDARARRGYVYRVDRATLKVSAQRELTSGAQFHPGGMQLVGTDLWVPLAEYRPRSKSTVLRLDPQSLETKGSFRFDDHLGGIAADGRGNVYAANWDAKTIYIFSEEGMLREKRENPTGVAYQDFEWHDGKLIAAGRAKEGDETLPVVDVIDVGTWQLLTRYRLTGKTRSGIADFAREGFSKLDGNFFLMPEDGPDTTVYRFALPRLSPP